MLGCYLREPLLCSYSPWTPGPPCSVPTLHSASWSEPGYLPSVGRQSPPTSGAVHSYHRRSEPAPGHAQQGFCPRHCREMARRSYSSAVHRGSCEKRGGSSRVDRVPPSSGGWCSRPRPGVGGYGTAKSTLSPPVTKTHHAHSPCGEGKVNIHIDVLIRCATVKAWHLSVA